MAFAVSSARRPYSSMVLWPSCHGPSISLPRHHTLTLCGSFTPWAIRISLYFVPPGWLQYSRRLHASAIPLVPRLTAIIISELTLSVHFENSFRPTSFFSRLRHASSSRFGRSDTGPTLSSQKKFDTKFPPGYRTIGTSSSFTSSITSLRNPSSSESGFPGWYSPSYTARPRCSMNEP